MTTVPVAGLKARLSRYLRQVKDGEEVLVTLRGIPVARIVPIRRTNGVEQWKDLQQKGLMRLGGKVPRDFWKLPRGSDPAGSVRRAIDEDREERS